VLTFKIVTIDGSSTATITGFAGSAAAAALRTTLAIPSTVTADGVTYPVTAIGDAAFQGCRSLTSVTFPTAISAAEQPSGVLTAIGTQAFANCTALLSLTLPASLTEIGIHAFFGCTALTSVKLLPTTPPTLLTFLKTSPTPTTPDPNSALKTSPNLKSASGNAFESIPTTCTFTCPEYALSRYQANPDWAPYFGAALTDDDAGDSDSDKTSIQTVIGGSGENVAALYNLRGQLLKKVVITLPATLSVLRPLFAVPSGLYILATPDGTRKVKL
jgi:hypothetical protein